jgi:transposase-like protein
LKSALRWPERYLTTQDSVLSETTRLRSRLIPETAQGSSCLWSPFHRNLKSQGYSWRISLRAQRTSFRVDHQGWSWKRRQSAIDLKGYCFHVLMDPQNPKLAAERWILRLLRQRRRQLYF